MIVRTLTSDLIPPLLAECVGVVLCQLDDRTQGFPANFLDYFRLSPDRRRVVHITLHLLHSRRPFIPRRDPQLWTTGSTTRIGDADRVRLGAHLAEGTTVMHEGFVNFNAGTLGAVMVEGRISAGVVVGADSDIGGGASIQGTLSGGGTEVISIGEGALLGANAGIGISLGDGSVVEAGLYVTGGTKVTLPDGRVVKAKEVSGQAGVMFIRNSQTGAVEMRDRTGAWGTLNADLHAN